MDDDEFSGGCLLDIIGTIILALACCIIGGVLYEAYKVLR